MPNFSSIGQDYGVSPSSGGYRFSFPPSPKIFGLPANRFPPPAGPPLSTGPKPFPPPARAPLAPPLNPPLSPSGADGRTNERTNE